MSVAASVLAVIPARYASVRFPGKPLAPIAGRPMIQHVIERVRLSKLVTRVVVATEDERIQKAVEAFGGEAMMTRPDHRTGTDRVAEVATHIDADIYLNVQGDEPLISPDTIDTVIAGMLEDLDIKLATPCIAISDANDVLDPHIVKVVFDFDGNSLYFSRAPIPWIRDPKSGVAVAYWKHLGLYAFRRAALLEYPTLPPGQLEPIEQLEQLRWLENGFRIRVFETSHEAISVDVPTDVDRVEAILNEGSKQASA